MNLSSLRSRLVFFQRATPPFAPSPLFSSQGPSAAISFGCGRQSVCEKYCCENWVLLHIAHTANRCYSEKNKTQTYPKREHFSSPPYHKPQGNARRPAAQNYSTPRHTGRGLAGHPRSVKLGSGDNKTRLYTSIRSKTPAIWRHGLHIGSVQQRSRPACCSDEFAGEWSRGNAFHSSE